jgi:hypothetical protein
MLDTVFGVPTHPLVVHAVVVLVPLAALAGPAVALVPRLRRRYGLLVGLVAAAAVVSVVVAQETGEKLFARQSARFGPDQAEEAGLMERHRELAEQLLPWTLVLLAGVALAVLPPLLARRAPARERATAAVGARDAGARGGGPGAGPDPAGADLAGPDPAGADPARSEPARPGWQLPVAVLAAAVTLVGAVATLVLVVRIGHLGSEAAWDRATRPAALSVPLT